MLSKEEQVNSSKVNCHCLAVPAFSRRDVCEPRGDKNKMHGETLEGSTVDGAQRVENS